MKNATAAPANLMPESTNEFIKENLTTNDLPRRVEAAVLRDASKRWQISLKDLEIVESTPQTWNNGCLGVSQPDEICTQALVPGWKVVVSDGKQKWIYHTNSNGRLLRIASTQTEGNSETKLPESLKKAVLQAASGRLNLPISQLNIVQAKQRTWNNSCLELSRPDEVCSAALIEGWRVVVGAVDQTLVYHTNRFGSALRLNKKASEISVNNLPEKLRDIVLADAKKRAQAKVDVSAKNIIETEKTQWAARCLGLPGICGAAVVDGWRVTVAIANEKFVYHTDNDSIVRLNKAASEIIGNGETSSIPIPKNELPLALNEDVIFRQISSGGNASRTYETVLFNDGRIIQQRLNNANDSQRRVRRISMQQYNDFLRVLENSGFDEFKNIKYPPANGSADYITYTLSSYDATVQYNDISDNNLPENLRAVIKAWNQINDTKNASKITENGTLPPVSILKSELPPPINSNVIFRQISSRGIFARTYETVLLNDGRIIRYEKGDANDPKRQVWQVSPQQVRQFQRLLEKNELSFQNLSYPATKGSADYITYTVTTSEGTIQYNDVSQWDLPKDLQTVVKAWNDIRSDAIANPNTDNKLKPLPIPVSELPPQLDRNVVFRQISSGGFIGKTYETILLNDGRLMQYRIGDANDSERRVWRVSQQKVREFQQVLKEHRFNESENLSYPATKGSADYITYTVTSDDTTVRYNDVSQNNLPKNLQAVVKAWNQIRKSYQ